MDRFVDHSSCGPGLGRLGTGGRLIPSRIRVTDQNRGSESRISSLLEAYPRFLPFAALAPLPAFPGSPARCPTGIGPISGPMRFTCVSSIS